MKRYQHVCETESSGHVQTGLVYGNASLVLTQLLAENGVETWAYLWDFKGIVTPYHFIEIRILKNSHI